VEALAKALLAGEQTAEAVVARAAQALGHEWRWLRPLAVRYVDRHSDAVRPRERDVVQFLREDLGLRRARERHGRKLQIVNWPIVGDTMQPVSAAAGWGVPPLESVAQLATWLGLSDGELEWLADAKGLLRCSNHANHLQHYHYRLVRKHHGGIRLIESPKPLLKNVQRQILHGILNRVPMHVAAHGFVRGRSIRTFAQPHVGQRFVLRMDLKDFFPSIQRAPLQGFFRTLGYPDTVANVLVCLCTSSTPRSLWTDAGVLVESEQLRAFGDLYGQRHLPQGAPTSPALANCRAHRLDCRLAGLATAASANYTRYADDLAFSGGDDFGRKSERFAARVAAIAMEEGFSVNYRKTRGMSGSTRQRVAGLVVNDRVNVARVDADRLKAILNNCLRYGPASQNREAHPAFRAHLEGRVSFLAMINPSRGERLRRLLDGIDWLA
jgi:hypothetical protein